MKVLVVDDDFLVRWSLEKALIKNGYEAKSASTGDEAVEIIKKEHFDVVITDLKMPGISGTELLSTVRELSPETKAVLITAFDHELNEERVRESGAQLFMSKPFDTQQLMGAVQELFTSR